MALDPATLPKDVAALTVLLLAENAARIAAETRSTDLDGQIANLNMTVAKIKRAKFGVSSEMSARLIDQLELQLGELIETATEVKIAATIAEPVAGSSPEEMHATTPKPARRPLDPKLPRERVVHGAPFACRQSGSMKIRKLDEKITKTLAPSHPIARGRATVARRRTGKGT